MPTATQEPAGESRTISSFYEPFSYETVTTMPDGRLIHDTPQLEFHCNNARFRLEVGSYGSAKSKPLLMEAIFHCLEFPGSNAIILRKTVPDLKRTVIDKFLSDVPRWLYETYNKTDRKVYFHPQKTTVAYEGVPVGTVVQSVLEFAACEREADVGKYLSTEYVFVGFEELGEFSFAIWDALEGRNRCKIPGSRACMAAATNPMGIGWSWIKKLWVDHKPIYGMDPEKYDPTEYMYFHSTVDQNPIYRNDKEYISTLEKSPNRDRIRWGKLDAVSGQYFDNFEPSRHVRPRSDFMFEDWQPVWIGWDYGFGHFACIVFFTKALLKPRWEGDKPRMVNVAIKEIYLHENTPEQQTTALITSIPRTQRKQVQAGEAWQDEEEQTELDMELQRDATYGYRWNIDSIHFSWERFNRTTSNRTVADEVGDMLAAAGLPRPERSNTDRVAGWQKMYSLFDADEFFILDDCPVLAEAIPLLVRDPVKLEDVQKPKGLSLNDDMGDACRYGIAGALLDPADKPEAIKKKEKYAAIKDPMRRAASMYRDWNLEQAKNRRPQRPINVPSWYRRVKPE